MLRSLTNFNHRIEEVDKKFTDKLDNLYTFGKMKLKIQLSTTPKILPEGIYLAVNGHLGYHRIASIQVFNITKYHGDETENKFYESAILYPNNVTDELTFRIHFNPYTCEVKLTDTQHPVKEFILYNIDETLGM